MAEDRSCKRNADVHRLKNSGSEFSTPGQADEDPFNIFGISITSAQMAERDSSLVTDSDNILLSAEEDSFKNSGLEYSTPHQADKVIFKELRSFLTQPQNIVTALAEQSLTENKKDEAYLPWSDYFISICFLTAARSKDPSTKVGACIVDKENRIVSVGYNGMPRGIKDEKLPWGKIAENKYDTKYPYVCHAEMNAIMNGRKADLENCCLYVTKFPCPECAKLIIQAGINHVIYAEKNPEPFEVLVPTQKMFTYAGVTCKKFIPSVKSLTLKISDGKGGVFIDHNE